MGTPARNNSRRQSLQSTKSAELLEEEAQGEAGPKELALVAEVERPSPSLMRRSRSGTPTPARNNSRRQSLQSTKSAELLEEEAQSEAGPKELALVAVLSLATLDDIKALKGCGPKSAKAIM